MKRFYKDTAVDAGDGGFRVLLDGKPMRTPAKAVLVVPAEALAQSIAAEWRDVPEKAELNVSHLPLTRLATTGIDRVPGQRARVIDDTAKYAASDMLCYRASAPESLVRLQIDTWQPLLDWAADRYGSELAVATGTTFVRQPHKALAALRNAVAAHGDLALSALYNLTHIAGSVVIALAISERTSDGGQGVRRGPARRALSTRALGQRSDGNPAARKHSSRHRCRGAVPCSARRCTTERMIMGGPSKFREILARNGLVEAMAAHSPLSAMLAAEAGFDAIWASGFELSAMYGVPDVSVVSMTQHLDMTRAMAERSGIPVVADIDTGFGNAINVLYAVEQYERAGAAAIVMEDKSFPKVTSLIAGGRQDMVRIEEFQGKIEAARSVRSDKDFVIVARTEALIAGLGPGGGAEAGTRL